MYDHLFLFRPYHLQRGVTGQTSNYFLNKKIKTKWIQVTRKKQKKILYTQLKIQGGKKYLKKFIQNLYPNY